jgi:phage shock protein A
MENFSHASEILKMNIRELIDRAEHPEKMIRQILRDLEQELQHSMQELSKVTFISQNAEKELAEAKRKSAQCEETAKNALIQGNSDSARDAMMQKVSADEDISSCKEALESVSAQIPSLTAQVNALRSKIKEARACQATLTDAKVNFELEKLMQEINDKKGE